MENGSGIPIIVTDQFVDDGEIVYGEYKTGEAFKEGKGF